MKLLNWFLENRWKEAEVQVENILPPLHHPAFILYLWHYILHSSLWSVIIHLYISLLPYKKTRSAGPRFSSSLQAQYQAHRRHSIITNDLEKGEERKSEKLGNKQRVGKFYRNSKNLSKIGEGELCVVSGI